MVRVRFLSFVSYLNLDKDNLKLQKSFYTANDYSLMRLSIFPRKMQKYALSEMIQWIFRSRIRNNESINIYIPSSRMRNLLQNFFA